MTDPIPDPTPEPYPLPVPPPVPVPVPVPAPEPPAGWWVGFLPKNWKRVVTAVVVNLFMLAVGAVFAWLGKPAPPLPPAPPIPTPVFPDDWAQVESEDGSRVFGYATGWTPPRDEDKRAAILAGVVKFSATPAGQAEPAGDADGNAFLWKAAVKTRGAHIPTRNQGSVGSCVSFGFAAAGEYALACQVAWNTGPPQDAKADVCQEAVYGFCRVEVNGGFCPIVGDGAMGSWAAQAVQKYGFLKRGVYGQYDLTGYNTTRCRAWGRAGVPDELEPEARKNLAGSASLVTTAEECKKALMQGYPVAVCSNVGYAGQSSRDADGFLKARGSWGHCMCVIGYRKDRDAFYILNSWGEDWVGGPLGVGDPPPGGFWAASASVGRMLAQEDSYAVSNVKGFPRRKLNIDDWVKLDQRRDNNKFDRMFALRGVNHVLVP